MIKSCRQGKKHTRLQCIRMRVRELVGKCSKSLRILSNVTASCVKCREHRRGLGSEEQGDATGWLSEVVSIQVKEAGQHLRGKRECIRR